MKNRDDGPGGDEYFSFGPDDEGAGKATTYAKRPRRRPAYRRPDPNDKSTWLKGPWQTEPDRLEWRSQGLPCLILRSPVSGALCGYVGVYVDHPWHGKDNNDVEARVHWGLSFSGRCQGSICHVPQPDDRGVEVWWQGFDCSHAFDLSPILASQIPELQDTSDVYRDIEFVQAQVEGLVIQAVEAGSLKGRFRLAFRKFWKPIEWQLEMLQSLGWSRYLKVKIRDLMTTTEDVLRWKEEHNFPLNEEMEWRLGLHARRSLVERGD